MSLRYLCGYKDRDLSREVRPGGSLPAFASALTLRAANHRANTYLKCRIANGKGCGKAICNLLGHNRLQRHNGLAYLCAARS